MFSFLSRDRLGRLGGAVVGAVSADLLRFLIFSVGPSFPLLSSPLPLLLSGALAAPRLATMLRAGIRLSSSGIRVSAVIE